MQSDLVSIKFSVFYYQSSTWTKDELWSIDLNMIHDDVISAQDIEQLYFLSDPVIGMSSDRKMVALVFLKKLFVFQFNETSTNYEMSLHSLADDLYDTDFDITWIHVTEDMITLVSDSRSLVALKRAPQAPPSPSYLERLWGSLMQNDGAPAISQFFFDTVVMGDIPSLMSRLLVDIPTSKSWDLIGSWRSELYSLKSVGYIFI